MNRQQQSLAVGAWPRRRHAHPFATRAHLGPSLAQQGAPVYMQWKEIEPILDTSSMPWVILS